MCLSMQAYVWLFAITWERDGRLSPNFQGCSSVPRDFYAQKFGGWWVEAGTLAFFVSRWTGRPCVTARRLGTEHWTGCKPTYRRRRRMRRRNRGRRWCWRAQPPLPHTRSLCTLHFFGFTRQPDLIATFLVVDACDMNSVNMNGCRELDVCRLAAYCDFGWRIIIIIIMTWHHVPRD